jgi:hypothetical protein
VHIKTFNNFDNPNDPDNSDNRREEEWGKVGEESGGE